MAQDGLRFLSVPVEDDRSRIVLNKDLSIDMYVQYMLDRTNRMFRYTGLPNTIPEYLLEYMLQAYGQVAIIEHEGSLYVMRAEFGGAPDPYYRPTIATIANPALAIANMYRIVNYLPPFDRIRWDILPPCIAFHNDTQKQGLLPLFTRYAAQMAENDVSIRSAQINLRQQSVISASDGPEIQSAQKFIQNLEAGILSVIAERPFLEGIKVTSTGQGNSNIIIQLIELQQYLKASWYNEIGLNSNFNMKRTYMSEDEVNNSADIMLPLIDNMLRCRQIAIAEINKFFGTDITVEKDSAWQKKQQQADMASEYDPVTGQLLPADEPPDTSGVVNDELNDSPVGELQSPTPEHDDQVQSTRQDEDEPVKDEQVQSTRQEEDEDERSE